MFYWFVKKRSVPMCSTYFLFDKKPIRPILVSVTDPEFSSGGMPTHKVGGITYYFAFFCR